MKNFFSVCVFLIVACYSFFGFAQTVFTTLSPESENDTRQQYETELIRLALEKTRDDFGDYRIKKAPSMNFARIIFAIQNNEYPNFFVKNSYVEKFSKNENMTFVKFPIDLGIVGYRVCFVPERKKSLIAQVSTFEEFKTFVHGQGKGWSDVGILRSHGLKVYENPSYEGLFKMAASGRVDLFCRGANELLDEWEQHKSIEGLAYDESVTLAYPLPRVLYTFSGNVEAKARITQGVLAAYEDGSLKELWLKHYKKSIDFVRLDKRKIFKISNPLISNEAFDYEKYFYTP